MWRIRWCVIRWVDGTAGGVGDEGEGRKETGRKGGWVAVPADFPRPPSVASILSPPLLRPSMRRCPPTSTDTQTMWHGQACAFSGACDSFASFEVRAACRKHREFLAKPNPKIREDLYR